MVDQNFQSRRLELEADNMNLADTTTSSDIPRHDVRSLKKVVTYYLSAMAGNSRSTYREIFEESRNSTIRAQFDYVVKQFHFPALVRRTGPPGIEVYVEVRWGEARRTLAFATSVDELRSGN